MNWNKAKTILIIFFICTNLFLLSTIIISTDKTSIVTDDIVASTTMILKNNRIEIDPEIIPRKTYATPMVEAENWVNDYEEFAAKFTGENTGAENNIYVGERGTISFSGDYFEFTPSLPLHSELTKSISDSNADKITADILKSYDFSGNNLLFDIAADSGAYIVTVTKQKDNLYYFNSKIQVRMTKNGVEKISGSWFFEKNTLKDKFTLKNVTGALIDYISVTNRPTTHEKIVAIDLGYSILEEGIHHKSLILTPCWRFTLEDGSDYILNAAENPM